MGEMANNEPLKLCLFPNSLTWDAFSWYINLLPNSIRDWREMQTQFMMAFSRVDSPITLVELTRMRQQTRETTYQFLQRFRKARLKCKTTISEEELVTITQDALDIRIHKEIEGNYFRDLYELSKRVTRYEMLLREESRVKTAYHLESLPLEVDMAKFVKGESIICESLVKKNTKAKASQRTCEGRKYSFDLDKADAVFYRLLLNGKVKLKVGHKIPTTNRERSNGYCKWHGSFTHTTRDCLTFRNIIQDLTEAK